MSYADRVKALALSLGYTDDLGHLPIALTHKSYTNENAGAGSHNERLEFLGDAVVGLIVAAGLMEAHPAAEEGTLSRLRAGLVNSRSLAEVARSIELGDCIRVGRGELRSGGRDKDSLLADAYEAIIGAVYLDQGIDSVKAVLQRHFDQRFEEGETRLADRDYKTRLQELVQARFRCVPTYTVVRTEGPEHDKVFDVELELMDEVWGRGTGRSKKQAERAAARDAWETLKRAEAD